MGFLGNNSWEFLTLSENKVFIIDGDKGSKNELLTNKLDSYKDKMYLKKMILRYANLFSICSLFCFIPFFFFLDKSNSNSWGNESNSKEENDMRSRAVLFSPLHPWDSSSELATSFLGVLRDAFSIDTSMDMYIFIQMKILYLIQRLVIFFFPLTRCHRDLLVSGHKDQLPCPWHMHSNLDNTEGECV